jgi:hypothetical protein
MGSTSSRPPKELSVTTAPRKRSPEEWANTLNVARNYLEALSNFSIIVTLVTAAAWSEASNFQPSSMHRAAAIVYMICVCGVSILVTYGAIASTLIVTMVCRIRHRDDWFQDMAPNEILEHGDYTFMCHALGLPLMRDDGELCVPMQFEMMMWAYHEKKGPMLKVIKYFPYALTALLVGISIRVVASDPLVPVYVQIAAPIAVILVSSPIVMVGRICCSVILS